MHVTFLCGHMDLHVSINWGVYELEYIGMREKNTSENISS